MDVKKTGNKNKDTTKSENQNQVFGSLRNAWNAGWNEIEFFGHDSAAGIVSQSC
jgi:hypothetical protein